MTQDHARDILIDTFRSHPDLPDEMKAILARLIMPPVVPVTKTRWWRR